MKILIRSFHENTNLFYLDMGLFFKLFLFLSFLNISDSKVIILLNACCQTPSCADTNVSEPWISNITFPSSNDSVSFQLRKISSGCDKQPDKIEINFKTKQISPLENFIYFQAKNELGKETHAHLSTKGTITIHNQFGDQQLPSSSYCIAKANETWVEIQTCCTPKNPCYRKCCKEGEGFDINSLGCVPRNLSEMKKWSPPGKNNLDHGKKLKEKIGLPKCNHTTWNYISTALFKLDYPRTPFRVLKDGKVQFLDENQKTREWKQKPETDDYCVDYLILPEKDVDETCTKERDILLVCVSELKSNFSKAGDETESWTVTALRIVYVTCLLFAMVCLASTAFILHIQRDQQNIHAWTIQGYVLSQFFFYLFLVIIRLEALMKDPFIPKNWCTFVGVIGHFFGLFTFSWLSVINFDLWWTFRILQPMNHKKLYCKRFAWYLVFAVSLPLTIIAISVLMHMYQVDKVCLSSLESSAIFPEYGKYICFLSPEAQLYYFYAPIGCLLLVNLIFYAFTTYKILKLYTGSKQINSQKHRQSCQLFFKLFMVMGILWVFQVIHAFVDSKQSEWYWILLDMINIFQALAIFIIFACKRETIRSLKQRYPSLMRYVCCCCRCRYNQRLYRTPTLTDRSTDGSTRLSRADGSKSGGTNEWQEPQEIIQLS